MDLIKHRVWGIKNLFSEFVHSKLKNKTCEMHFCKKVKIAEIFSGNIHFSKSGMKYWERGW